MIRVNGFEGSWKDLHIKGLILVGIQGLPNDPSRVGFSCIYRNDSEWIGEVGGLAVG